MTPHQHTILRLAHAVPADQWVSFGDLADAMQALGHNCTARNVSNALNAYTELHDTTTVEWRTENLWGRVRNADGHVVWARQGGDRPRSSIIVKSPDNARNAEWAAAGGRLVDGAASPGRRYPVAALARAGKLPLEVST